MTRKTFRLACIVLAASVAVVAPVAVSPGAAERSSTGPDCSGWLTEEFWQSAAVEDVERCLAAGWSVDARDWEDFSPLHYAASLRRADMVNALVVAGAKVEARIDTGATPLHLAVVPNTLAIEDPSVRRATLLNTVATVNALIAAGGDVDVLDRYGRTPLSWVLLSFGYVTHPDVFDVTDELATETVNALIAAGANVNARIRGGIIMENRGHATPLHWAVGWGMPRMVKALIAAGAKINARSHDGLTPLHRAARGGQAELIIVLLDSGADAAARDDSGHTAFDLARIYEADRARRLRGTDALRRLRDATPK